MALLAAPSGCARTEAAGQEARAALLVAVAERGAPAADGGHRLMWRHGGFLCAVTAARGGLRFSLETEVAGLRHVFSIPVAPAPSDGVYACTYTLTGGSRLALAGRIDFRDFPREGSITAETRPDYPAAYARVLFAQQAELLLSALAELLEAYAIPASAADFFPCAEASAARSGGRCCISVQEGLDKKRKNCSFAARRYVRLMGICSPFFRRNIPASTRTTASALTQ